MEKANKGKKQTHYSDDEKIEIAKRVCDLYASQTATLESCCEACGVSDRMFLYWRQQFSEVAELYKKARLSADEIFFERLAPKTMTALEKLINGTEYTQKKTEEGIGANGAISKEVLTEMIVLPNATAVIFTAKGIWPEKFAERKQVEHSGEIKSGEPKKTIEILFRDRPTENESKEDGPTGRE